MPLPPVMQGRLALPVIASPMFILSGPALVIAQCRAGVVGAMPSLNARPAELLDAWLGEIEAGLAAAEAAGERPAPYAVNLIVHGSNDRLEHDLAVCEAHRVPIVITSLRAPGEVVARVQGWGGVVFHDVTTIRHAEKALEAGVNGLVLVAAGAGGHAGTLSPFALVGEVRRFFDGPIALSGAIASGQAILAAQAMGADLAYIGTRFIASAEANADPGYKQMVVDSAAADIVYTPLFTGVPGNYLRASIARAGLDPDDLPLPQKGSANFGTGRVKPWKDVWGAGQGVGQIADILPAGEIIARLGREYRAARAALCGGN